MNAQELIKNENVIKSNETISLELDERFDDVCENAEQAKRIVFIDALHAMFVQIFKKEKELYPSAFETKETLYVSLKDYYSGEQSEKFRLDYLNLYTLQTIRNDFDAYYKRGGDAYIYDVINLLLDDFIEGFEDEGCSNKNICLEYSSGRIVEYTTF